MKLNRLIAILLLMESRGNINVNELARALEVSKRTIHRDIEELCEAGVPIASSVGQSGGYYLLNGYTSCLKSLCTDEVITLYLSGIGIHPQKHTESGISLQNALMKLEKILSPSYAKDIKNVRQRFLFDPEMWWNHKDISFLEILRKSVLQSKKVNLSYLTASLGKSDINGRTVCPYGMVVKHGEWYLVGYCESKNSIRTFKCDRIISADLLPDSFIIPEEFSLDEYWNDSVDKFKNKVSLMPNYPVRLRIEKKDFKLPENIEIIEETDSAVILNLYSFSNAIDVIWNLKQHVAVIAPDELKHHIYSLAEQLLKKYT
jgi:predicted DNA-binding transcriptional regulator YafY